jgi:hypothetical protein
MSFNAPVNKMSVEIKISNDSKIKTEFVKKGKFWKEIKINNVGKSNKNNYLVSFVIDSSNLYKNYKISYNCSDLQVFDSTKTNIVPYYVQGYNSPYTTVFVRLPKLNQEVLSIWLNYGNIGTNKINFTSVIPISLLNSSLVWLRSNVNHQHLGVEPFFPNNSPLRFWKNKNGSTFEATREIFSQSPNLEFNKINGLPSVVFDGSKHLGFPFYGNLNISTPTIFTVAKGNTTFFNKNANITTKGRRKLEMSNLGFRSGDDGDYIPFGTSTTDYHILGATSYDNTLHRYSIDGVQNTSTVQLYHTTYNDNTGCIGRFSEDNPAEYLTGEIAEIIVLNQSIYESTFDFVNEYLNTKYRIYNISDFPTITQENEIESENEYNYKSFLDVDYSTKLTSQKNFLGVAYNETTIKIKNGFYKYFFVGSQLDYATNTINQQSNNLKLEDCKIIKNDGLVSELSFNQNLSTIETGETMYNSTENDFIVFDLYYDFDTITIDKINSYIEFVSDSVFIANAKFYFDDFINFSNANNFECKLKKGDHEWSEYNKMRIKVIADVPNSSFEFNNFRIVADLTQDQYFSNPSIVEINQSNQLTTSNVVLNKIIQQRASNEIELSTTDFLNSYSDKKFKDLVTVNGESIFFNNLWYLSNYTIKKAYFFTELIKRVLTFLFPVDFIDVDLTLDEDDLRAMTLTVDNNIDSRISNLNFFVIDRDDFVIDFLNSVLSACCGFLYFDNITKKITARNVSVINATNIKNISDNQIITNGYKINTSDSDLFFNTIEQPEYNDFINGLNPLVFFDNEYLELRPNTTTSLFVNISDYNKKANLKYINNAKIIAFKCTLDYDETYNNANVGFNGFSIIENKTIIINCYNNNSTTRYLRVLNIIANFTSIEKTENSQLSVSSTSRNKNGIIKYEYSDQWGLSARRATDNRLMLLNLFFAFVITFSSRPIFYEIEFVFNPDIQIGNLIKINNNEGVQVFCVVLEVSHFAEKSSFRSQIRCRRVFY